MGLIWTIIVIAIILSILSAVLEITFAIAPILIIAAIIVFFANRARGN